MDESATVDSRGTLASEPATDTTPSSTSSTAPEQVAGDVEFLVSALAAVDPSRIDFLPGASELTPDGEEELSRTAAVLLDNPSIPFEVVVRSNTESTPGELGLSTQRADTVFAFLVAKGVDQSRLAATVRSDPAGGPTTGAAVLFETPDEDLSVALDGLDLSAVELTSGGALTEDSLPVLDEVAAELSAFPGAGVTVAGYASDQRSADANHARSHTVADRAAAHLVEAGVDPARLTTIGFGDAPVPVGIETVISFEVGAAAALSIQLQEIDNETIRFEPNTALLTTSAQQTLDAVAIALAADPTRDVEIGAHTYTEATSQANHDLSHLQGEAVIQHLVDSGIDSSRLLLTGHGDSPEFMDPGRDGYVTFTVVR
jgi:outer membrane protein OmpA-like peptidoglycan-associated protein